MQVIDRSRFGPPKHFGVQVPLCFEPSRCSNSSGVQACRQQAAAIRRRQFQARDYL